MSINKNTIRKFKRLFDAELKATQKYYDGLNIGFAGISRQKEEALRKNSTAASNKIYAEFKKHNFTSDQWDDLLTECGYFDCGWEYEVMIKDNENE